jgi:hypothetical protein
VPIRTVAKKIIPARAIPSLRKWQNYLFSLSLQESLKEQDLQDIYEKLSIIVPELLNQYTTLKIDTPFLELKVRALHSFQVSLVGKAIEKLSIFDNSTPTIVDIGDSAGTHIQYLQSLYENFRSLSVNCDKRAVDKIKQKGMEAIHARAEELEQYNISPDIFLAFEILEHLFNPIGFLHNISINTACKGFVITVPYRSSSRVSLGHIRYNTQNKVFAENTHIFEFSPDDWKLIFKHAGWEIKYEEIFLQYPRKHWLRITKKIWKETDFEGFYGAILTRDSTWSSQYSDW